MSACHVISLFSLTDLLLILKKKKKKHVPILNANNVIQCILYDSVSPTTSLFLE